MNLFHNICVGAGIAALGIAPAAADESAALAILSSADSDLHAKAMACDALGQVGTAKAVPVLGKLLADPRLHDYARDGLERIPDASAGKALLGALPSLEANLRIGVIITLGDRREKGAVGALEKIAKNGKDPVAAASAISSLGKIANPKAGKAIIGLLSSDDASVKAAAKNAALSAAQRMEKEGSNKPAKKLRAAVEQAG